ncbi:aspartic proteinase CDR1-like [Sesamum indicum]|uniref:Aspartic proteinase CDR1-like n=1 Tax=Sesamum indicum TaxID=4182 RepID=A0A6I9TSM8_SESIN|nr:aspartic proteinase CDR1-like [Sesamum indicum]
MSKTMILLKPTLITYIALTISLVSMSKSDPLTEESTTGLTIDLIHRDSPQSPSYDPLLTPAQRLANALRRSFNRLQRFKADRLPQPDIINSGGEYLMKYSIGTPAVPSLGIADTGSDITWTQCQPCLKCFKQELPLFQPNTSSTYRKIPCNAANCTSFPEITFCSVRRKKCLYTEGYGDGSFTQGVLSTDTLTLASTGRKRVSVPNFVFGCGFRNGGTFTGGESGIVGLGGGKASLVRQLGFLTRGKFSYCLVSVSDNTSKLNFGANAEVLGRGVVSTPMVMKSPETFYRLTLEGISVGNQRLEMSDSGVSGEGNIIIDSGTTLTLLPIDLYNQVENALKSSIKLKRIKDPQGVLDLCYFTRNDIRIPEVTVHFKGADLKLRHDNVLVRTSNVSLCLAAKPVQDLAIYGYLAQVNFLVGYDLVKRTVSFKAADCGRS